MSADHPKSLTPTEAMQMLDEHPQAVLVDIRSTMEYLFVGHPKGAVHVPWIDEPDWVVNPHFSTEIRKLLLQHPKVLAAPSRARFVGFGDRDDATAMCNQLKQQALACLAMQS